MNENENDIIIRYEEVAKIYISEKILINWFFIFMNGKGYLFYDKLNSVNYNCERFSSISLGRINGWEWNKSAFPLIWY